MTRREKRDRKARKRAVKRFFRHLKHEERVREIWKRGIQVFSSKQDFLALNRMVIFSTPNGGDNTFYRAWMDSLK